jgi:PKD repeat protein
MALAVCVMVFLGAIAASAGAASYGELKRFGGNGKGAGQFISGSSVHAVGVDPTDNSVYVGDQPKENEFRIQKFNSEGKFVASVTEKFKNTDRVAGLEGIAIDPSLKRIYALTVYEREEEEEGDLVDPELPAAGALYAFSTTASGTELVAASGTTAGVLASKDALHAQSEATHNPTGSALLEPAGIALDPTTGDVIILGQEDQGGETLLVAAQRVHSDGSLGTRWVDTTECFEGEGTPACTDEEGSSAGLVPNSPVVTAAGKVLVLTSQSDIWEIPASFASGQAPKPFFRFGNTLQNLVEFPGSPEPSEGGAMAYVHEGTGTGEGRLFVSARIVRALEIEKVQQHQKLPGVLEVKVEEGGTPTAHEVGWTGGASKTEHEECAISISGSPTIGAGTGQTAFLYDISIPTTGEEQKGVTRNPHVDVFGPNGSKCPAATATTPVARVGSTEVGTEKSPVLAGQKVSLTSTLTLANALSVEWDFGDGTAPVTESAYQFETSRIEHTFTGISTHTVKETIHTDNLAEPTIVKEAKIVVSAAAPTAQFSGPSEVAPGQSATFDGKGSSDPNGKPIVKYTWTFGDGSEATTTTSSVSHTYATAGSYTVGLKVTDELNLVSAVVKHTITVATPAPPPSEPGNNGGNSSTPTTTTGTTPSQGVLPIQEHKSPEAKLAVSSLSVSSSGGVPVKVSCPAGASCAGTVTLRTIGAVSASVSAHAGKKAVLTLATGSFTVSGGAVKTITLHLSAKARKLLAKAHTLRAKATVTAHDSSGAAHTSVSTVTLKLAAKKPAHH